MPAMKGGCWELRLPGFLAGVPGKPYLDTCRHLPEEQSSCLFLNQVCPHAPSLVSESNEKGIPGSFIGVSTVRSGLVSTGQPASHTWVLVLPTSPVGCLVLGE